MYHVPRTERRRKTGYLFFISRRLSSTNNYAQLAASSDGSAATSATIIQAKDSVCNSLYNLLYNLDDLTIK